MRDILGQKIADALVTPPPPMTRRGCAATRSPRHLLAREHLGEVEYRALLSELETEGRLKVEEPAAPYDSSKMTQRRLFD
jgi:hypothetical protein